MPLQHSSSPSAFKANVKTLMGEVGKSKHVQSPQQALAIAYSEKRRAKRASGGWIDNAVSDVLGDTYTNDKGSKRKGYDTGGSTDPVSAVINALQSGSNQTSTLGNNPGMNNSAPTAASFAPAAPPANTQSTIAPTVPANSGLGTSNPLAQMQPTNNMVPVSPGVTAGVGQNGMVPATATKVPGTMKRGGVPHAAIGGMQGVGQMPWYVRNEAHSLNHSGPIMSAVPGRTDRHPLNVGSGAYVLPADHVSSLGQGNTQAGMHILNRMFGTSVKMPIGAGAPKPPHMMGIPGDKGGARGDATGKSVPVIVAGGEFIISPEQVAKIGGGDIKHGHSVLDKWVIENRKNHVKTLRKLPGPAKA